MIQHLEQQLHQQGTTPTVPAPAPAPVATKPIREGSVQWQEVNALLEDEIGRMRAQLIKSRSIRRENQETVLKLQRDFKVFEEGSARSAETGSPRRIFSPPSRGGEASASPSVRLAMIPPLAVGEHTEPNSLPHG